jgi:hypothetical protein
MVAGEGALAGRAGGRGWAGRGGEVASGVGGADGWRGHGGRGGHVQQEGKTHGGP